MIRRSKTISADYFDGLYREDPDPWRFQTSAYEHAKYDATVSALSRARYSHALEIGCSIGVLTSLLAPRCEELLAMDGSPLAIAAARAQNGLHDHVTFAVGMVPPDFPPGPFDLVILSEVLYYLSAEDLADVAACCFRALTPGGEIILCHWLGETDYPLTGLEATELFIEASREMDLCPTLLHSDIYRLVRLQRRAAAS